MKVGTLTGWLGTRIREETSIRPKPMIETSGDWAQDRLLPDFLRAMDARGALSIRFKQPGHSWLPESLSWCLMPADGFTQAEQSLLRRVLLVTMPSARCGGTAWPT